MFFAPRRRHAVVPVVRALLTPGKRTVMAGLRVLGLAQHPRFERDHRVLNRATRLCLAVSRILLGLLVTAFVPDGPLILGIDETLKRRRGAKTVRRWLPNRTIVAVADGTATALDLLDVCLNRPMPLVSSTRFPLHALQYEPTPPRTQGQLCRIRLAGKRLPTLACLAIDPTLLWIGVTVASWYRLGEHLVEIGSVTPVHIPRMRCS